MFTSSFFKVVLMLAGGLASTAVGAIVSGTPADFFARTHQRQVTQATEGIVYQVPDDKLEPGKLYHDASKDGNTRVTRKRVVGSMNQVIGAAGSGTTVAGSLDYDVVFTYKSTRASNGKGSLEWKINHAKVSINDAYINEKAKGRASIIGADYAKSVAECEKERVFAHEMQHVNDTMSKDAVSKVNPVWLHKVSAPRTSIPNSEQDQYDSEILLNIDKNLYPKIEEAHKNLIWQAEARAVKADVDKVKAQLQLAREFAQKHPEKASSYVPALYDMMAAQKKSTYGDITNLSDQELNALAEENVLLASGAAIQIGGKATEKTYREAYEDVYKNETPPDWETSLQNYQKLLENMYEKIHAYLYEKYRLTPSIESTLEVTPAGSLGKKMTGKWHMVDWLKDVLAALTEKDADKKTPSINPDLLKEYANMNIHTFHEISFYATEETEQLRAQIFYAIADLASTGVFYDAIDSREQYVAVMNLRVAVNGIVEHPAMMSCRSKDEKLDHTGCLVDNVYRKAVQNYREEHPKVDFFAAYRAAKKTQKGLQFGEYMYQKYRDAILSKCSQRYKQEAQAITNSTKDAINFYNEVLLPALRQKSR